MLQPNVVASLALAVCAAVRPEFAVGQSAIGQAETASSTVGEYTSGDPGADFTRPLNLFQLRYEYRSAPEVAQNRGRRPRSSRIRGHSVWITGSISPRNGQWVFAPICRSQPRTPSIPTIYPASTCMAVSGLQTAPSRVLANG
jgi:hypothetical protein